MAIIFEGSCKGRAVEVEVGLDNQNRPRVRWNMEVAEGPHAGKVASYSGKLDPENIKFTKRDMMAIGWKGQTVASFIDDVKAANAIVPFTAEKVSWERPDGSISEWTAAKFGGSARPLGALDKEGAKKLDSWFAEAGSVGEGGGTKTGTNGQRHDDSDLPF